MLDARDETAQYVCFKHLTSLLYKKDFGTDALNSATISSRSVGEPSFETFNSAVSLAAPADQCQQDRVDQLERGH